MKKLTILITMTAMLVSCSLDRFPETTISENNYWNPTQVSDFEYAANYLYALLQANWLDLRGDDLFRNKYPNDISAGTRKVPATSTDWSYPYKIIFWANRIIENAPAKGEGLEGIQRYVAEAYFFRAYAYSLLLAKYGGVPILTQSAQDLNDPILYTGRSERADVAGRIFSDLEVAEKSLPLPSEMEASEYGRVSWTAAKALESRVALFEASWQKYHCNQTGTELFEKAGSAALAVMESGEHSIRKVGKEPYKSLFDYEAEGDREFIFVKIFGYEDSQILTHNAPYQYCVNHVMSRNFANLYLTSSGLPYEDTPALDMRYNDYLEDRDPRLTQTVILRGEVNYTLGTFIPSNPGFTIRKFVRCDGIGDQPSTLDWPVIRYAEVLLSYAEAVYETAGSISDTDLDKTINILRDRVSMPHLTNALVQENGLDMLAEIRRERSVELALEGFRYDDIRRWKQAEDVMPEAILGAKFIQGEWGSMSPSTIEDRTTEDMVFIIEEEDSRFFDPDKDYLYPIPSNDIAQSLGNVTQNPNWK